VKRSQELKIKRATIYANLKAMDDKLKKEGRTQMTTDEDIEFKRVYDDMSATDRAIELAESVERNDEALVTEAIKDKAPETRGEEQKIKVRSAMRNYMAYGMAGLNEQERSIVQASQLIEGVSRANQSAVTANLGAEMVKEEYMNEFEKHMISDRGVMSAARIIRTNTGGDLPWPTVDDTAEEGVQLGEGVTMSSQEIATDGFTLKAWKFATGAITVPMELLQDDGYGFVSEIPQFGAERINRITNRLMTTGNGTTTCQGITIGAANSGVTITANTITRAKLIDLIHSVNYAYRSGGKGKLMFSDAILSSIIKLSIGSSDDRPLWTAGMVNGAPAMIEGYQYVINDYMPSAGTADNRCIVFGDLSKYYVRLVQDYTIKRADELHIASGMIGFYGFARVDGRVANSNAIKYLAVAS